VNSEKTLIWRGQKEICNNNNFFRCVCLILTRMSMNVHEFPNLSDEQSQTCLNYAMTKRKS